MLTLLVPLASAHSGTLPHVHPGSPPLGLLLVGAWLVLAAAWWRGAREAA